jgi:hypothetical protein
MYQSRQIVIRIKYNTDSKPAVTHDISDSKAGVALPRSELPRSDRAGQKEEILREPNNEGNWEAGA